jgi:hypothetical protein
MQIGSMLSMVGLSAMLVGGDLPGEAGSARTSGRGLESGSASPMNGRFAEEVGPALPQGARPSEDAAGQPMAATERKCEVPRWGESEACAAFALASGASVEIALLEVKDVDTGKDNSAKITFRLHDVKGGTTVHTSDFHSVGGKFTYSNKTNDLVDLVVRAKSDTFITKLNIRFSYEKK